MKVFFDTSVPVAALVTSHSLAELFSVLTSLPVKPRVSASDACRLVGESVQKGFTVVPLTVADYGRVVHSLGERNLPGGTIYDALLALAARKSRADSLVTLNPKGFRRLWVEGDPVVTEP